MFDKIMVKLICFFYPVISVIQTMVINYQNKKGWGYETKTEIVPLEDGRATFRMRKVYKNENVKKYSLEGILRIIDVYCSMATMIKALDEFSKIHEEEDED